MESAFSQMHIVGLVQQTIHEIKISFAWRDPLLPEQVVVSHWHNKEVQTSNKKPTSSVGCG